MRAVREDLIDQTKETYPSLWLSLLVLGIKLINNDGDLMYTFVQQKTFPDIVTWFTKMNTLQWFEHAYFHSLVIRTLLNLLKSVCSV